MSSTTTLLTAEEFATLPGSRYQELVGGEIVTTMPPGGMHGILAALIAALLIQWNREVRSGLVGVESGFILAREPDLVRSPDVYYVRAERLPAGEVNEGFWNLPPDLAVEIVSPNDSAEEVTAKVYEYLAAGTAEVWVVYPRLRRVIVHTPDGMARSYDTEAQLRSPILLPGFSLIIKELFG